MIPKIVDHFVRRAAVVELGNLDVYREYNDVRQVCDVYLKLLARGELGEIYNVCSGKAVSLRDVLTLMTQLSGWQLEVRVNPAYVRQQEVHTLCGSGQKLSKCIGINIENDLHGLLAWMYEAAVAGAGQK